MSAWAQTMLLWSWQSLLLIGFVLVVVRLARSQSAASRHSFWLLAVLVISILPGANAIVRALPIATPSVAPIAYMAQLPSVTIEALPAAARLPASARDLVTPSLFAIWIAGMLISAARSFRVHRRWHQIVRSAVSVEQTGFSIPVAYSTRVEAPVLVGTVRPMIVMPADIETWTNAEERRAVLLHELAHVERRDHWIIPVQAFLGAIFFFHPAVRYALRQLIVERELACDEQVLAMGTSPSTYAEVILRVAEHSIPDGQRPERSECKPARSVSAVARNLKRRAQPSRNYPAFNSPGKTLERRIEMILSYPSLVAGRWHVPAVGRASIVLALASLLLPPSPVIAETPVPPPPEIRVATIQPLLEAMSTIASAVTKEAAAGPVQAAPARPRSGEPLGTVSGTIFDPTGLVIPGVTVTLAPVPPGTVAPGEYTLAPTAAVTNAEGRFSFPQAAPGQYTLQTRTPGFSNTERAILVRSGETLVQEVFVPIARIMTSIEVSASRPITPQSANTASSPRKIGGDIAQPNPISLVKPQYPAAARASGIQGFVLLQAVIGKDGTIVALQVDANGPTTGDPDLIRAAMDAVRQWRYRPGFLNGSPIEVATTITVNFSLQ